MAIDGISVNKQENYVICCIDDFSDELKNLIREELNYICHGKTTIEEDTVSFYSYKDTLKEFIERYRKKSTNTKKGMIGELIAHLVIDKVLTHLQTIGIFFNKEEASIRKGFDLTYVDLKGSTVWYGEVKSGEVSSTSSASTKNNELLGRAKKGMKENLTGKRANLWRSVLTDTALTFASKKKITVQNILKNDLKEIRDDPSTKKNAILVSVLFHDSNNKVSPEVVQKYLAKVVSANIFSNVVIFSIQKSTYSKIEQFLCEESLT